MQRVSILMQTSVSELGVSDSLKHDGYQNQVDVHGSILSGYRLIHSVRLTASVSMAK